MHTVFFSWCAKYKHTAWYGIFANMLGTVLCSPHTINHLKLPVTPWEWYYYCLHEKADSMRGQVINWPKITQLKAGEPGLKSKQFGARIHAPGSCAGPFPSWSKVTDIYWVSTTYPALCLLFLHSLHNPILMIAQEEIIIQFFKIKLLKLRDHVPLWYGAWA